MDQETLLNVVRVLIPSTADFIACESPEVWEDWIELELQEIYNSDTDPGGDSSDLEKGGGSNVTPNPNNAALGRQGRHQGALSWTRLRC